MVYYTIIDKNAKILLLNDYTKLPLVAKNLSSLNCNIDIICGTWWTLERVKGIIKLLYIVYSVQLKFQNINVSISCNTSKECWYLKLFGINAFYCNHNCFVDEKKFQTIDRVEKKYDAVYNAVLKKWKRHNLSKNIKSLALVTYNFENSTYKRYLDTILSNPKWYNYKKHENPKFLSTDELVIALNECKVGLALSKQEGAMYSSMEYLMCGLPVVSTRSKGGRDVFFNSLNSVIVEDNPRSVKKGLNHLIQKEFDPHEIRKNTLKMVRNHRKRFIKHVNDLIINKGYKHDISDSWDHWFIHKLRHEGTIEDIRKKLV